MARKKYRPWLRDQAYLFPPTTHQWLGEEHLVFFVMDVVSELDIEPIERAIHRKDPRGEQPYDPRMMLALWIYGYASGVHSSRGVARAIEERVDFRAIAGDQRPAWTTLNRFRRDHRAAFQHCFVEVLRFCDRLGMVHLGHVAVDGTKVKADASKHKAMSYGRMKKELAAIEAEVAELMQRSDALEAEEDARLGRGDGRRTVSAELSHRQKRLARIREAKAALEKEAAEARAAELRRNAANKRQAADHRDPQDPVAKSLRTRADQDEDRASELSDRDDDDEPPAPSELPRGQVRHRASGEPHDKAQRNFTDPDSRIMKGRDGGFIQAYNAQAAADTQHQVIVAADVTNQAPDARNFGPMLHQTTENLRPPKQASGDCGYWSEQSAAAAQELGVTALIPLGRTKRWKPGEGTANAPPPEHATPRERMEHTMNTQAAREAYRARARTIEPVFGQIKECTGFRQFSFRGLAAVAAEWKLVCLAHNIRKAWRFTQMQPA